MKLALLVFFFVCTNFSLQSEDDKISTADELKKLGVTKPGHIARLKKAINMLPDVPFARDVPVSFQVENLKEIFANSGEKHVCILEKVTGKNLKRD